MQPSSSDEINGTGQATLLGSWFGSMGSNSSAGAPVQPSTHHHGSMLLQTPTPSALRMELRWGFLLHTYGFACLFFLLAFYAFFSILNLRSLIASRPFMSTINGFLCLLGVTRASCLFIDPYNLKEALPKLLGSVLWDLGFPCLTSAFCLVQLAFLQLTQLKLGPEKLRKKSCLSLVITTHFSFVFGADIMVAFQNQLLVLKYLVETVFLVWGVLLCCLFLYAGYRVMYLLRSMPGGLLKREPADAQHKGIMQLAMLAPYNNLAGSVAAALMPTILTPKIRITDENDQTFSFCSDSGSPPPQPGNGSRAWQSTMSIEELGGLPARPGSPDPRRRGSRTSTLSPGGRRPSRRSSSSSEYRRGSDMSYLADIAEDEAAISLVSPTASSLAAKRGGARRHQSVGSESDEEVGVDTRLLPQSPPSTSTAASDKAGDLTLHSILNHIAYMNKTALKSGEEDGSPKSQVRAILHVTYTTAILGLVLCVANAARVCGPYGMMAASVNSTNTLPGEEGSELYPEERPRPWPWFLFQTLCRALEFAMGCAMANITKQPMHSRHVHQCAYSLRLKYRESLYI